MPDRTFLKQHKESIYKQFDIKQKWHDVNYFVMDKFSKGLFKLLETFMIAEAKKHTETEVIKQADEFTIREHGDKEYIEGERDKFEEFIVEKTGRFINDEAERNMAKKFKGKMKSVKEILTTKGLDVFYKLGIFIFYEAFEEKDGIAAGVNKV
jgi:hypothetical protein